MSTAGQAAFRIPQFSSDDLSKFFESHLSDAAVKAFDVSFIHPCDDDLQHTLSESSRNYAHAGLAYEGEEEDYEEDDGLGYYPDGVKRTLTDEQIEIFRHSELHALQRKKEKEEERKAAKVSTLSADASSNNREGSTTDVAGTEEGEVEGDRQSQALANKKKRKRKGKNGKHPREPKPDLRKRTWDVVETGLDSLDYD